MPIMPFTPTPAQVAAQRLYLPLSSLDSMDLDAQLLYQLEFGGARCTSDSDHQDGPVSVAWGASSGSSSHASGRSSPDSGRSSPAGGSHDAGSSSSGNSSSNSVLARATFALAEPLELPSGTPPPPPPPPGEPRPHVLRIEAHDPEDPLYWEEDVGALEVDVQEKLAAGGGVSWEGWLPLGAAWEGWLPLDKVSRAAAGA